MMRADAAQVYEGWRQLWLSGGDSNAIAALRYHGLRRALAMASCNRTGPRPPLPSSANMDLPVADAAITEAASQVRYLLRVPTPPANANGGTTWEYGENRHV